MRAQKKSERKLAMRQEARRKVRPDTSKRDAGRAYRDEVEKGRQRFLLVSAEGGDPQVRRIKGELTYLLNNYLPKYENRINQLIDAWRRSGDPSYDPAIRVKLRQARRDHMSDSNPL